ncbi:hypothetical protein EON65_04615 [archaeon]|nr:MAG: hypothetical protein EON65_04615 [archaeon]
MPFPYSGFASSINRRMLVSFFVCVVVLLASFGVYAQEFNSTVGAYDNNQAKISVWLSAAAYCGKSEYATHTFKGPTTGFVVTKTITHSPDDTQGYVGYLPSDKSVRR